MQALENSVPGSNSTDRALLALRDQRDDLSIQISIFENGAEPDPLVLFGMLRRLELLDRQIANHRPPVA